MWTKTDMSRADEVMAKLLGGTPRKGESGASLKSALSQFRQEALSNRKRLLEARAELQSLKRDLVRRKRGTDASQELAEAPAPETEAAAPAPPPVETPPPAVQEAPAPPPLRLPSAQDEARLAATQQALAEAESRLGRMDEQTRKLRRELADLRSERDTLQDALDRVESDGDTRSKDLRRAGIEVESLRETLAERDRAALAAAQHITELGQTVTRLENELGALRSHGAAAIASTGELQQKLEALNAENKALKNSLNQTQAEVKELSRLLEHNDRSGMGAHMAHVLKERAEQQQELLRVRAELEAVREEKDHLDYRVGVMNAERQLYKRKYRIAMHVLDAEGKPRRMGEILLAARVITSEQLQDALKEQKRGTGRLLGAVLLEKGYVREHDIAQVVASQLQIPFVALDEVTVTPEAAQLLDPKFCVWHMCVALRATPELIVVAVANPLDTAALDRIEQDTHRRVVPIIATLSEITDCIESVFGGVLAQDPLAGGLLGR